LKRVVKADVEFHSSRISNATAFKMVTNGHTNGNTPEITLYTNHGCPWAHRAHIILAELGLPFKEVIIDLDTPREPWYLKVNPRGLVPTIDYNGEIIPESGIVAQFLADAHPSHLEKTSSEAGGALQRARINFFVDAFISKVNPNFFASLRAADEKTREEAATKVIDAVVKEVEPLLSNAAPFFGGSSKLTLAEVQTGSFVLRIVDFPKYGLLPANFLSELETRTPNFYKWIHAVAAEKSVNHIWDGEKVATRIKHKLQAAAQK